MAKSDPKMQLAQAALKLLARKRWSDLTLSEVSRTAKLPFASIQRIVPNKEALLGAILEHFAAETGRLYRRDRKNDDVRDRVLDACLTLLESMSARKPALRSLHDGLSRDPLTLLSARSEIVAAAGWLLALAEADAGAFPQLRAAALAGIVARAIPVWLDDDKEMNDTMAQLDKDLRLCGFLFGRGGGRS